MSEPVSPQFIFLSGLPRRLQEWLNRRSQWTALVGFAMLLWGSAVVAAAFAAEGAALYLDIRSEMLIGEAYIAGPTHRNVHGYAAELNHGLLYLTLAPLTVVLGLRF